MKHRNNKAGKHRRYEVKKAVEMKKALNKERCIIGALMAIGITSTMLPFLVPFETLFPTVNNTIQSIFTGATFICLMLVSMRMYQYVDKNKKYKDYCSKTHITKIDELALKDGIL